MSLLEEIYSLCMFFLKLPASSGTCKVFLKGNFKPKWHSGSRWCRFHLCLNKTFWKQREFCPVFPRVGETHLNLIGLEFLTFHNPPLQGLDHPHENHCMRHRSPALHETPTTWGQNTTKATPWPQVLLCACHPPSPCSQQHQGQVCVVLLASSLLPRGLWGHRWGVLQFGMLLLGVCTSSHNRITTIRTFISR